MDLNNRLISKKPSLKNFFSFIFLSILLLFFFTGNTYLPEARKNLIPLTIKGKKIKVEVVRTEKEKEKGLMFRESLGKDEGMLFIYDREEMLSFWMKNTRIPLSIAFIDQQGRIVDIQDMEPFSLRTRVSARPAQYALEVNQGWFKKNGIDVGDVVKLPPVL